MDREILVLLAQTMKEIGRLAREAEFDVLSADPSIVEEILEEIVKWSSGAWLIVNQSDLSK